MYVSNDVFFFNECISLIVHGNSKLFHPNICFECHCIVSYMFETQKFVAYVSLETPISLENSHFNKYDVFYDYRLLPPFVCSDIVHDPIQEDLH